MVHSGNDSALLAIEISGDFVAGSMELLRWKQITCLLRRDTVLESALDWLPQRSVSNSSL